MGLAGTVPGVTSQAVPDHVACFSAEFPWASCIAVGAALGTNLIEFVAGQVLYSRMLKAAATAAKAPAHGCDVEVRMPLNRASNRSSPSSHRQAKCSTVDNLS